MLSNQKIKFIQSLAQKKFRELHNAYVIEGTKIVETAVSVCPEKILNIYLSEDLKNNYPGLKDKITVTDEIRMKKISNHSSPSSVIAIMEISPQVNIHFSRQKLKIFLDGVQDPGNVGTIIRTCDWYGTKDLILSSQCADLFSPKVIQAAMGSHFGMNIFRMDFLQLKNMLPDHIFIGAEINGDLSEIPIDSEVVLCLGSEGRGLTEETKTHCNSFVSIPGSSLKTAESLNVSVATGILLDRFFSAAK